MSNWHTIQTGLMIGALVAIAISSCIALFQFDSGAPWQELLEMWGKMLLLTIPTFASGTAAAMLIRHERRNSGMVVAGPTLSSGEIAMRPTVSEAVVDLLLSEVVVANARDQASWYYESGLNPTRRTFEECGVSQTIWNSGRHILTTAKIVDGDKWSPEPWIVIETALDNIHAETDRVWVRPLGERRLVCLHIDEKAKDKRFTHQEVPDG